MFKHFFLVSSLLCVVHGKTWNHFNFHRDRLIRLTTENDDFPDMWFPQRLDHFDHTNVTQWKQRYQKNDQMYKAGGPILLMLGGEGPIGAHWMTNGLWFDVAQKHNGVMFQLEHRFYGSSHPTPDCSVKNLRFLSSQQALADAATFVSWVKSQYPSSKVFSFGGSYSGALSAWLRLFYPHLIDGSFSASGPYRAKVDFFEYEETVNYVLDTASIGCADKLATAVNIVTSMFQVEKDKLKQEFRLCDDLTSDGQDLYSLIETLMDPFDEAVQYGDDNRNFEGEKPPVYKDAKAVCTVFDSAQSPVDGLSAVIRHYLNATEQKCLDASYSASVKMLSETGWIASGVAGGARQWVWQTCTEFGYYQTVHGTLNMSDPLPLSYFIQQCGDVYGTKYGMENFLDQAANNSNIVYGGLDLKSTRTIIFNGNYDPWSQLSVTWPLAPNHETYTFFVPQAAHCAVLYPASETDTLALQSARSSIMAIFDQWITGSVEPDFAKYARSSPGHA